MAASKKEQKQPQNTIQKRIPRGVILDLLDMYDLEIEVLYIVVEYHSDSYKLNYRFKELKDEMFALLEKWQIPGWEKIERDANGIIKGTFYLPFYTNDLFLEYQFEGQIPDFLRGYVDGYESELSNYPEEILVKMHATRKLIKRLLNSEFVDEKNDKRDEDIKDIIEGTKKIFPEVVEEERIKRAAKKMGANRPEHITKMEITAMPEMRMQAVEDKSVPISKKQVSPPKFKATEWSKISIRFINEHDVYITAGNKSVQSRYDALGFEDSKRNMPNRAWKFLFELAHKDGVSDKLTIPIPEDIKQTKKKISDRLKTIFDNDTDPFYDPTDTRVYRIKIKLIPPEEAEKSDDKYGVQEYFKDKMIDTYEPDE